MNKTVNVPHWAIPPEHGAFATDRGWEIKNGERDVILTSHRGLKEKVDSLYKMKDITINDVMPEPQKRHKQQVVNVPVLPNVDTVLPAVDDDVMTIDTDSTSDVTLIEQPDEVQSVAEPTVSDKPKLNIPKKQAKTVVKKR
jgi:hypothetical protein